jgi:hypothetical protein
MSRSNATACALVTLPLFLLASASGAATTSGGSTPRPRVLMSRTDVGDAASVGCRITITARNDGPGPVTIRMRESRSGYRAGVLNPDSYPDVWSPMNGEANWQIAPNGAATSTQVELPQPCSAGGGKTEFRYEFVVVKAGTQKTVKFPANNEFSSETTISLGNVARHF